MLSLDGSTYMGKFGRDTAVQSCPNFRRALRIINLPRTKNLGWKTVGLDQLRPVKKDDWVGLWVAMKMENG